MTKEELIELGIKAGFAIGPSRDGPDDVWGVVSSLERFAKLIAEHEREACAKVCEEYDNGRHANAADLCAEAIRARGQA